MSPSFERIRIVYPDFTFLSRKTKQEIYWEHDGRMDDPGMPRTQSEKSWHMRKTEYIPVKV